MPAPQCFLIHGSVWGWGVGNYPKKHMLVPSLIGFSCVFFSVKLEDSCEFSSLGSVSLINFLLSLLSQKKRTGGLRGTVGSTPLLLQPPPLSSSCHMGCPSSFTCSSPSLWPSPAPQPLSLIIMMLIVLLIFLRSRKKAPICSNEFN